jgi:hypothetical protein
MFFLWLVNETENPRLTGNRGFLEILLLESEVRSHDAGAAANTHPNRHLSFGERVLQCWSKRDVHIRRQE